MILEGKIAFDTIRAHAGHEVQVVYYGESKDPFNVAIECVTCSTVLVDCDSPRVEREKSRSELMNEHKCYETEEVDEHGRP